MATVKSYTDIEQSKKLAEILSPESADLWYWEWPTAPQYNNYELPMPHKGEGIVNVPCWSLAALLGVLPNENMLVKTTDSEYFCIAKDVTTKHYNNTVDACFELILKLKEKNLL